MIWALTTVSYRYHLHGFPEVLELARQSGFGAIELWEPHFRRNPSSVLAGIHNEHGIPVTVFSGYQNLTDFSAGNLSWAKDLKRKLTDCQCVGARVLRLFSGALSSADAKEVDWQRWFDRIDYANSLAAQAGVELAFETHPGTLLDCVEGVVRFISAVRDRNWSQVGLNFDAFHVWEFGTDPLACLSSWYPHVKHVHLKNASRRTGQFAFTNVYHPTGCYDDLTPLCNGVVNIAALVAWLHVAGYTGAATLEHFGPPSVDYFREEIASLEQCLRQSSPSFVS
ncbi:MAG: sugar phosphate isomerase/epimerase [Verrucomicrobia bacterium]|nr:sugar phosphate isomerase/epimerase [Verrucomicrobiota bacterium]